VITFDLATAKLLAKTPQEIAVQLICTNDERRFYPYQRGLVHLSDRRPSSPDT